MAAWIQCSSSVDGQPIFINMNGAITVQAIDQANTQIAFSSESDSHYVHVRETPRESKGEKRPADVVGTAVMIAKIATGEIEEESHDSAKQHMRRGGGRAAKPARAIEKRV